IVLYKEDIPYNTSHYSAAMDIFDSGVYYWRVIAKDDWEAEPDTYEVRSFSIGLVTGIHDPELPGLTPRKFTLGDNYPNPFNNHTLVKFGLPRLSEVKIRIYSVTGKLVYSENHPNLPAGHHIFKWNGRSNSGNTISSGIYFLVISNGKELKSQKITLIK
ncbi:MAG: T9SS type A sorting domain-containing protein, partial [bacterium]|nr:T9SS type A sorting domain-containing protein [bacterium]